MMTVFFSDIENFTNSTAGLAPEVITDFVNRYLSGMTDIIQEHAGMIDKYEGDAIMALYGAPVARPDHAKLACWATLAQFKKLVELNAYYKQAGLPQVNIRAGINTGEMVVGNLGSSKVLSYTVMGDEVILASRLEGVNKFYQTRFMISDNTYQQAKDFIEARELDTIRAKGMKRAVRIYEVVARKGEADANTLELFSQYAHALLAYRSRQYDKAIELFNVCLKIKPGDGPSLNLIEQCEKFKQSPPDENWDATNTLTAK
jgi:adenylate cyclase